MNDLGILISPGKKIEDIRTELLDQRVRAAGKAMASYTTTSDWVHPYDEAGQYARRKLGRKYPGCPDYVARGGAVAVELPHKGLFVVKSIDPLRDVKVKPGDPFVRARESELDVVRRDALQRVVIYREQHPLVDEEAAVALLEPEYSFGTDGFYAVLTDLDQIEVVA